MHLGRVNKKRNYISVIPFTKLAGLNPDNFIIVRAKTNLLNTATSTINFYKISYLDSLSVTFIIFELGIYKEPVIASIPHPNIENKFNTAIVLNLPSTTIVLVSKPSFSNVIISSAFNLSCRGVVPISNPLTEIVVPCCLVVLIATLLLPPLIIVAQELTIKMAIRIKDTFFIILNIYLIN
tara:strand:+ start:629 stop:1171 length:543 start_codon:yes stop_codon:yes gene_type:complete